MNDIHDTELDQAIRLALATPEERLAASERAALDRTSRELRKRIAIVQLAGVGRGWFVRRRLAPILGIGLAVCLAVALAPSFGGRGHGDGGSIPTLPATANAREVLEWAGTALEDDTTVGSGDVWHAIVREHRDGKLVGVRDYWYSQNSDSRAEFGASVNERQTWASLDAFDGKVEQIRTYERDSDGWRVPVHPRPVAYSHQWDIPGGRAPTGQPLGGPPPQLWKNGRVLNADEQDPGKHQVRRVSATVNTSEATHRWLRAASSARTDADLERATYIFLRTTRGEFVNDIRDRNAAGRRATTVRQLVHLMSVARLTPSATRAIYAKFAQLGNLQRLEDVTIDGRPAARIQFETGDISNTELEIADPEYGAQRLQLDESVLVIDRQTAILLRTESIDRKRWTEYERPERVSKVGANPASCERPPASAPCDLLRDVGPLADEARRYAKANNDDTDGFVISGPYTSHPWLGNLDEDGLPLDDYNKPLTWPSTPEDAKRLGVDYTSCSGRTGGPTADRRILYPDPNIYCDPLYPLAELPE